MTDKLRAAAEAAIGAMVRAAITGHSDALDGYAEALRAALAEQDAEPVARYSDIVSDGGMDPRNKFDHPPRREWQSLTDHALMSIASRFHGCSTDAAFDFARAIEQKLKEKNHDL